MESVHKLLKTLKIKNMILITKSPKKVSWFRWLWNKNNKTRNNLMKKILIVVADYYKDIWKCF